jgi:hypothetical protein
MYYPKSQIRSNLYTNGGEYINSTTNVNYSGYYYELSNGKSYTGKTPEDGPNILLVLPITTTNPYNENLNPPIGEITLIEDYEYQPNLEIMSRSLPSPSPTIPTTQEQQVGAFTRYFSKKNNELKYMEINKETYTQLKSKDPKIAWDLYSAQLISWQIKGTKETVYKANKSSAALIEKNQKWYGFSQYFKDQFSKYYLES